MEKNLYIKKHWKPPFLSLESTIIILSVLLVSVSTQSVGDVGEDVEIHVERMQYSLQFTVIDSDNYVIQNVTCRNVKSNSVVVGNDQNTCEDLDPCSEYFISLSVKSIKDETIIPEITRNEKTEYKEPSVIHNPPEMQSDSVNLTWSTKDRTCVSNFNVEATSDDKVYKITVTNEYDYVEITDLYPCQMYNILHSTYDVNNKLILNHTENITTCYEDPGNITLTIKERDDGKVHASWDPVQHQTCVKFYYFRWYSEDCDVNTEGSDSSCVMFKNVTNPSMTEFIVSDLEGCENYIFEVYINDIDNIKARETFKSPEQIPGPVPSVEKVVSGINTVELYWLPSNKHKKCVKHYYVKIVGPLQKSEPETFDTFCDGTDAIFDNLDPCGDYNYTITPQSLNNSDGETLMSEFKTLEGQPSAVRNFNVKSGPYNLSVTWDPPDYADLCLSGYRLSGWDDENKPASEFDKTVTDTNVFIQGLKACVVYTVQIIPMTKTNMDGELLQADCETAATVTQQMSLQIPISYHDHFNVVGTDDGSNNKCETIFARLICEARTPAPIMFAEKYLRSQLNIIFNTDIGPLSPYTEYICYMSLFNVAGWSPNITALKKTERYFPDPPENLNAITRTNYSLKFTWNAPKYPNGIVNMFILNFRHIGPNYYYPSARCNNPLTDPITLETSKYENTFNDLQPYSLYSLQVALQNDFGIGEYTLPLIIKTKAWISDPITNAKAVPGGPSNSDVEYEAYVVIRWNMPCKTNGEIEYFKLDFIGERTSYTDVRFSRYLYPDYNTDGSFMYNETNILPEYSYNVTISVKTVGVQGLSRSETDIFLGPPGLPKKLDDVYKGKTRVEPYESSNPSKTAIVRFPADILESDSGTILYVALLLSQKECDKEPKLVFDTMDMTKDWPDSMSWNQVYNDKNSDCITQYQTTPKQWKPINGKSAEKEEIEFIIGTDNCEGSTDRYCNGPLKPDTDYYLIIRLFTRSGYSDAALLEFRTDALIELTIILVSVSSCLLLAFIAGFIYIWVTKRMRWHRESCHGIEDSFGDVIGKKFAIYYREIAKSEKIGREFKELTAVALDLSYSASEIGCNKNRYADIFPYDKNRVILDIDADGSDYINASFIDGYRRRKEYIATQGPKPESTKDFWRMILQHNVRVVVMVTQFREGDIIKCHEYYPFKSKGINVIVKKKDEYELYDRTEMSVTHETFGLKQKIVHFYFKKWPDHGCPTDPMHLITFIRKVKAEKIPSYSPIVVHCSAGVGRTGTFIGLDIIMQRLKNESKINIYETVKKLRFQRMKMVQSLTQYTFLYTCAFELVKYKYARSVIKSNNKQNAEETIAEEEQPDLNSTSNIGRNTNQSLRPGLETSDVATTNNYVSIRFKDNGSAKPYDYDVDNSESFM